MLTGVRFRFRPWVTVVLAGFACSFILLGNWQLDRAEEKRRLQEVRERMPLLPPLGLRELTDDAEAMAYRRLALTGRYVTEASVFIENRKHRGRLGLHVVTPFLPIGSERAVLVNRGWFGPRDEEPTVPQLHGDHEITGEIRIASPPGISLGDAPPTGKLWPYLTVERFETWSGMDCYPFVLLLTSSHDDGLARRWPAPPPKEGMHLGYAFQWYAFATIAILLWLRLSWRPSTLHGEPNVAHGGPTPHG